MKNRYEIAPPPRRIVDLEIKIRLLKEDILVIDLGLSNCPGKAEADSIRWVLDLSALSSINQVGNLLPV